MMRTGISAATNTPRDHVCPSAPAGRPPLRATTTKSENQPLRLGRSGKSRGLRSLPHSRELGGYFKILTARAITSPNISREPAAWIAIAILAQRESGITSVGLNAVALVKPRYR